MLKRRTSVVLIGVLLTGLLCACKKEAVEEKASPTQAQDTIVVQTPEVTKEVQEQEELIPFEESALKVLSEELTTQAIDGQFERINSYMKVEDQKKYTPQMLKQAFTDTVKDLGAFITIDSSQTQTKDDLIYVAVKVEYEKKFLQVLYAYNKDIQLTTFYLTYLPKEQDITAEKNEQFEEKEVTIGKEPFALSGLLTVPQGVKNPPVVILVAGSGPNDMDETIGEAGNKPFRDLAHGLAKQGIASLRYNKRYYQYADAAIDTVTIYDEVLNDVGYAIEFAQQSSEVDAQRIYIIGHSLGGMLAPKIASEHPEVVGMVCMAGSPRHLEDIIYDQVKVALEQQGLDQEKLEETLQPYQDQINQIKNLSEADLGAQLLGSPKSYWKSLNDIDTPELVKQLKIPMLFLQGSADIQVSSKIDFAKWKEILKGHSNALFKEYEGLNHLFMPTTGALDITDYDTENQMDQKVIDDIALFIQGEK